MKIATQYQSSVLRIRKKEAALKSFIGLETIYY